MPESDNIGFPDLRNISELERFRNIRRLHNHWSRPAARQAYYWYLTFEHSPQLHSLATECQKSIAFPYYDLTPLRDLHMTLDRVAFTDDITEDEIASIEVAAKQATRGISPFNITIGALGGTAGAIGFTAFPARPIRELRNTFRTATLSVCPDAPVRGSEFHPHVTIAYANSDAPAAEAIAAVEKVNSASVDVTIREGVLVLLKRHQHSYSWQAISRIPLVGS